MGFSVPIASSPSPERQDAARPSSKNPLTWTVDDVVWFVKDADPQALGPHVELFRKHVCRRLPLPPLGNLSHKRQPARVTQAPQQPWACSARLNAGLGKEFSTSGWFGIKKFHLSLEMGVKHQEELCEKVPQTCQRCP